ncbi:MAG TPA: hypothetical protein VFQ24_12725 [Terriglobia bacterium]|nr:hypothetical protein [Terriglobia bacterium]
MGGNLLRRHAAAGFDCSFNLSYLCRGELTQHAHRAGFLIGGNLTGRRHSVYHCNGPLTKVGLAPQNGLQRQA